MMPDFVVIHDQTIALPPECETDMAARAAFIAKAEQDAEAPTPAKPAKAGKE